MKVQSGYKPTRLEVKMSQALARKEAIFGKSRLRQALGNRYYRNSINESELAKKDRLLPNIPGLQEGAKALTSREVKLEAAALLPETSKSAAGTRSALAQIHVPAAIDPVEAAFLAGDDSDSDDDADSDDHDLGNRLSLSFSTTATLQFAVSEQDEEDDPDLMGLTQIVARAIDPSATSYHINLHRVLANSDCTYQTFKANIEGLTENRYTPVLTAAIDHLNKIDRLADTDRINYYTTIIEQALHQALIKLFVEENDESLTTGHFFKGVLAGL